MSITSSEIFEGVNAVAQLGMAVVVGLGVWVAYKQLHSWRDQAAYQKRSEAAENLLSIAIYVSDEIRALRSPYEQVPVDKVDDKTFTLERRYNRFVEKNDLFQNLRDAQVKAEAVLGNDEVRKKIDVLFQVRNEVLTAIDMLISEAQSPSTGPRDRSFEQELRWKVHGTYSEKYDPLGMRQLEAIKELKLLLSSEISPS
ncbi:hypothetical protein [Ruegeria atlantica]|uniref:hypothetical protein n=1 Tax=Ruegeria atlantica TaxID=81569 RepID=UPI001479E02F|nr:hypothetical protein [Ruegeria atlantica]